MGFWRLTSDLSKPGAMTTHMENSQDGTTWKAMMDGTYKRES